MLATTFARSIRQCRPMGSRALSLAHRTLVRSVATHSIDFQKRSEYIPTVTHPEDYKPSDEFEDEFEYGIASEPSHAAEEFAFKPDAAALRINLKVPETLEPSILYMKHGHEAFVAPMALTAESRLDKETSTTSS